MLKKVSDQVRKIHKNRTKRKVRSMEGAIASLEWMVNDLTKKVDNNHKELLINIQNSLDNAKMNKEDVVSKIALSVDSAKRNKEDIVNKIISSTESGKRNKEEILSNILSHRNIETKSTDVESEFVRNKYYSYHGEDAILYELFRMKGILNKKGVYVDVGAYRPIKFSLTYLLYKNGWNGINIDPVPGTKKLFDESRKGDVNLEYAVTDSNAKMKFYMFNNEQENTLNKEVALKNEKEGRKITEVIEVQTKRLSEVLDENLTDENIDFLNIDVEGVEINVLKSNNWNKYRPKVIALEDLNNKDLDDISNSAIYKFMKEKNYYFFAKTMYTHFYYDGNGFDIYEHLRKNEQ